VILGRGVDSGSGGARGDDDTPAGRGHATAGCGRGSGGGVAWEADEDK
jgi:hypothetical protein